MNDFKRRDFIKLNALSFAGIALQLNAMSSYAQKVNGHFGRWNADTKLNWDAFLERLTQLAKNQHQLPWDQKAYTEQVKKLLLKCNFPEFENVKKEMDAYENKTPDWFEAASLHDEIDFQVSLFQFEKGEYISHHDHPDMTGVINVVSGDLLAKNYTIEEDLTATREVVRHGRTSIIKKCTIREVGNEIIKKGDVSILTAHEGNIHSIMPNRFTQLVDVFTPAYTPDTKSKWFTVDEDGFYQGRKNLYEAEYTDADVSEIKTIKLTKETLNRYKGTYITDSNHFLIISQMGEKIFFQRTQNLDSPGKKTQLLPYEENKFWLEGQEIRCAFNIGNENNAESMTIHLSSTDITAVKLR